MSIPLITTFSHPSDPFKAEPLEVSRHFFLSTCEVCQQRIGPIK